MSASQNHSLRSSHREALLEHLVAGEVMKCFGKRGEWHLEVLKPQVDDGGYDLVLDANGIVRYVQLKASFRGSTVTKVNLNTLLGKKPSGCVVFVWFDAATLDLGPFAFFGAAPGEPLPDLSSMKVGRHTKANAQGVKSERPNIRELPVRRFEPIGDIEGLVTNATPPLPADPWRLRCLAANRRTLRKQSRHVAGHRTAAEGLATAQRP